MDQERPSPPIQLKPWYYQDWFLMPVFILWPVWAVLILRSPWHNGLVSGAIAWAMLMAGSFLVVTRLQMGGTVMQTTLMFVVPGAILTVVTQVLWFHDKKRLRDQGEVVDSDTVLTAPFKARKERVRQRGRRRRNSRPGRPARRR